MALDHFSDPDDLLPTPRSTGVRHSIGTRRRAAELSVVGLAWLLLVPLASSAHAQVRGKRPDRGTYQSPTVRKESRSESRRALESPVDESGLVGVSVDPIVVPDRSDSGSGSDFGSLQPVRISGSPRLKPVSRISGRTSVPARVDLTGGRLGDIEQASAEIVEVYPMDSAIGCDAGCCDGGGCDSIGCNSCSRWGSLSRYANGSIVMCPDRWFGSIEVLLMFRSGDRLPPLVTTGPETDADTAGQLGEAGTSVLAGDDNFLNEMTAGGRLTIGTWLDSQKCRSLVLRGWLAGEETYSFSTDSNATSVIARPFLDVTDGLGTPIQETQLIAFPARSSGSISVHADSDVAGGDLSVRQRWRGGLGAVVDVLYGYQYMRLDENLQISSVSTSLDDNFAPLGSVIAVNDHFRAENEFHGGQIG
ncbi:MAG: BBP7 family outer membrane beta-barrel protein, partial [Planctomycetota bacterium]